VDGAVCCEPLSGVRFPVKQGEYWEFGGLRALPDLKSPAAARVFSKIPYPWNREFKKPNREINLLNRQSA
jgi:hypothetical protein